MLNIIKLGLILLALFTSLNVQAAGGIALGATRVIYPSEAKQTSLAISNSDTKERYSSTHGSKIAPGRKKKRLSLRRLYLSANQKAKTRYVLSTPGSHCPWIGNRYSG